MIHGSYANRTRGDCGKTTTDSSILKQLFFDQVDILHSTCAVSSNDAANCYDAINHAAGSFCLHVMKVPMNMIQCYLLCKQTMHFGIAMKGYGGTQTNPYMGLTQGSGASPTAWLAISMEILAVYRVWITLCLSMVRHMPTSCHYPLCG